MLTQEQQTAYDKILSGSNVFLTGKAGTGKTYVIDKVLEKLDNAIVIAPTGTAAINAKGITIHKFLKLKAEPPINSNLTIRTKCSEALTIAKTIILDEVSMCRMDLFDCLISSIQKYNSHAQIVVVGDFCQLPPVISQMSGERELLTQFYGRNVNGGFAFQGDKWAECNFEPVVLTKVMRQENEEFIHNLNKARIGDETCIPFFTVNSSPVLVEDGIYLSGRNNEVSKINNEKLAEINGKTHTFKAVKNGEDISRSVIAEEILELKVGAKVMFLCNDASGNYHNGSIGRIIGINGQTINVLVNGKTVEVNTYEWESFNYIVSGKRLIKQKAGSFVQIPLKLAYAVTIHKSQGQTYEKVNLNPECWDSGQLYCALSRIRDIKNLYLTKSIKPEFLRLDKEVRDFYESLDKKEEKEPLKEKSDYIVLENNEYSLFKVPVNKKQEVLQILEG